jgi:hypothetical protein
LAALERDIGQHAARSRRPWPGKDRPEAAIRLGCEHGNLVVE